MQNETNEPFLGVEMFEPSLDSIYKGLSIEYKWFQPGDSVVGCC